MMKFSQELAIVLSNSADQFPVDLDDAWQWLGYGAKRNAKDTLTHNFCKDVDYLRSSTKNAQRGRPSESIKLTIDCFKSLGMMAGTEKGRQVRQYFLECERIAKEAAKVIPAQNDRIREMEMELEILRLKDKYLLTSSAILNMHGFEVLNYILRPGEPIPTRTEYVRETVMVNNRGQAIASFDGVGITEIARRYHFGTSPKGIAACRAWLDSVGIKDEQWQEQASVVKHPKLPRELLKFLDTQMQRREGDRQLLIGEEGAQ